MPEHCATNAHAETDFLVIFLFVTAATAVTTTEEAVTTPEATTPEVTTPAATTPEVTTPAATTPEVTTPAAVSYLGSLTGTAPPSPEEEAYRIAAWDTNLSLKIGWCYSPGMQWDEFSGLNLTLLSHQADRTATPELCQAECAFIEECAHFTWWNNTGDCFLGTNASYETPDEWGTQIQSVVGPKVCPNTLTTTNTTTTSALITTTTTTAEGGGLEWWAWLLIILGILGVGGAIAGAVLMNKKEAPKKKKTRAIKPAPAPVETKAEPVPTYTRVIHPDGRMEQVTNYAPPAGTHYAAPMAAPGSFVVVPGLA
jgi:hypothetical protein